MSDIMTSIYNFNFKEFFVIVCRCYSILFCLFETYLLLFPMFMLAWSSGTYEATININMFGEADIEMFFWALTFPFVMYGTWLNLRCIARGKVICQ